MAVFKAHKVVSTLPDPIEPDTLYYVRTGVGFDAYLSDTTGSVAYKQNASEDMTPAEILTAIKTVDGFGSGLDADLLDGVQGALYQRQIDEYIVDIGSPDASGGDWFSGGTDSWGTPRIGAYAARFNDASGYLQFNIPAGMDTAYISQLTYLNGGYVDVYGVQSDEDLVFLRRINTIQKVEGTNEGPGGGNSAQFDGSTITLAATGLSTYSAIRLQNRLGRFHLTGMSFTSAKLQGAEGTGMVHPAQLSVSGSGSGLDADLLDGQHGNYYYSPANAPDPTLTINGDASGSATFTNLGNATLTLTIADDSHNHVISNVDGLQAALDGALMVSELTDEAAVKALNQGVATTDSPSFAGLTVGNVAYPTVGPLSSRNKIINGAMAIDQRNNGAAVTPAFLDYTLDRWQYAGSIASKFTIEQNVAGISGPAGFANYAGLTNSSAASIGAGDYFLFRQMIEANNIADLGWGGADAKPVTLSFWVRSSLTGTFGGAINNGSFNRSYPFAFAISASDTWEYKTITIPGDTSGIWEINNSIGIHLHFGLGVGAGFSGTAGSWYGSGLFSATGATSVVGTSGATFYITGVQLEAGDTATPFEHRSYGQELALCQRYYQSLNLYEQAVVTTYTYACPMRAIPTLTSTGATAFAAGNGFVLSAGSSALRTITASAEL